MKNVIQWVFGLGLALMVVHNPKANIFGIMLIPSWGAMLIIFSLVGFAVESYIESVKR